jgi:hypothetical protein
MVDAQQACQNRKLFSTLKGYLRIGPTAMQEGDVCCVFLGATVPFILRKEGLRYVLLGESYVHGVMRGEVLQMCQPRGLYYEDISIC